MFLERTKCELFVACHILLQTVREAVELMVPSELEAMQVYSPESWKLTGWISKLPDCSRENLGTCTEPLAKTCDPAHTAAVRLILITQP